MKQPATLHYAGVDWATRTHAVCVVDPHGAVRARFEVPNTGKGFSGLCNRLVKLGVAGVAIERPDGPLVEAMLEAALRVVVVTPRQVKALRSRYAASGAKSDPADAYLLADVLRTDGHRLASLTPDSDPTKVLRALTRTRKDLQEARMALVNQLTSQLERCFPGAVGLVAELHSAVAVAFLRRYPTSHATAGLTQAKLAAFLRRLHYPARTPVTTLLGRIQAAPAAGISPAEATGRATCVLALLEAIQVTARQERELEAEIVERLEVHADQHRFTSLPRAGHGVRAAALLAELGDVREQDPATRPPSSSQLAWRLGVTDSYVRHVTWQLRTRHGQPPLAERLAATHQQLTSPPPPVEHVDGERDWRLDAACAEVDPELFFPEPGQVPQAAAAKAVCAGCAVRGPCLEAALQGPQARDDHAGIFAGTTARQRVALRGRPAMAQGTRFVHDRTAAEEALALANQKSIDQAAHELGVSKQALRRAFDHHDLPQPQLFQGGPRRTRFYDDRDAAEQAWRRAAEVGINQTRKELGVSDRALRTAWQRHGLGLPPRPTNLQPAGRLDLAFVALNRDILPARARSDEELAARVRRAEEYAVFGAEVVVEMGSETYGKRPAARAWAITRRAQRAHRRHVDREHRGERRQADRATRADRPHLSQIQVQERDYAP